MSIPVYLFPDGTTRTVYTIKDESDNDVLMSQIITPLRPDSDSVVFTPFSEPVAIENIDGSTEVAYATSIAGLA